MNEQVEQRFDLRVEIETATADLNEKKDAFEKAHLKLLGLLELARTLAEREGRVNERIIITAPANVGLPDLRVKT